MVFKTDKNCIGLLPVRSECAIPGDATGFNLSLLSHLPVRGNQIANNALGIRKLIVGMDCRECGSSVIGQDCTDGIEFSILHEEIF